MFIVHYEDGKTITEAEMKWDDLPNRDRIKSVQLKWDFYDFSKVLTDHIGYLSQLMENGQEFRKKFDLAVASSIASKKTSDSNKKLAATEVISKTKALLKAVQDDLAGYRQRIRELRAIAANNLIIEKEKAELVKLPDLIMRGETNVAFLNIVIMDMEAWLCSDEKMASLVGSSKNKYFFWQDKASYFNITINKDLGVFEQRVGMIIDKERTVVCEMNLRTGFFKIYLTTIGSLKLNLPLFPYIDLEKVN